jgi:DNA-binding NtrC family response regulator
MKMRVAVVFSAEEASKLLAGREIPVVCSCAELPDGNYRSILKVIKSNRLKSRLLVIGEAKDCGEYLKAMEIGAFDFLPVPYQSGEVERIVRSALEISDPASPAAVLLPRRT